MRVLLVEDEKKTAAFVRKALQSEGVAVDVCHNGEEAWIAVVATRFDAIVLDIMLPGRDGLSVLRELRGQRMTTPVLVLSARGEVSERVEGLNPGADDYLPKPFDPFFRGDASHSQTVEGCGLGLSIARWIVSAHGGTIPITSEVGGLTTATVGLPVAIGLNPQHHS